MQEQVSPFHCAEDKEAIHTHIQVRTLKLEK